MEDETITQILSEGGIGAIATDTGYSLIALALDPQAVWKVYQAKHRDPRNPFTVLISEIDELERFGVVLNPDLISELSSYWPGPYSIILPTIDEQFEYLHRGTDTIAFRIPDDEELRSFIKETGPIIAPSACPEGMEPAETAQMVRSYFGTDLNFVIDSGPREESPVTILRNTEEGIEVVRE